jgi:hypothetical protein
VQTAKLVFTIMILLIVLPVIGFNLKSFVITVPGEKKRYNKVRIGVVALAVVLITWFCISLYYFTIDFQPLLVAERYSSSFNQAAQGKIKYEEFEKWTKALASDGIANAAQFIEEAKEMAAKGGRFQLGEEMLPRHYIRAEIFPVPEGVGEYDSSPIYMFQIFEFGGQKVHYLLLMELRGNEWKIIDQVKATQEQVEYAEKNNFIKAEQTSKWFE